MAQSTRPVLYGGARIAAHLGLTRRQVYALADAGRLPVFREGCVLCSTEATLDEWRQAREAEARGNVVRR